MKLQLEQINFTIGDLTGNYQKIVNAYNSASNDIDLVIFSELALTGYPPEDLLLKPYFLEEVNQKIKELCKVTAGRQTAILVGTPTSFSDRHGNKSLYNCAFLIENGEINSIIRKTSLPNYGIFDERRYFAPSPTLTDLKFRDFSLGFLICEDLWHSQNSYLMAEKNLDAIITINASPYDQDKKSRRIKAARQFMKNIHKPLIYVNQVGAQDSTVFDGASFVLNSDNELALEMAEFKEDSAIIELQKDGIKADNSNPSGHDNQSRIYSAALLGIRDYISKNGFEKVLIGMSGGIDSALCACLAVDALGSENVKLVALPTQFNSKQSLIDAEKCSENLGIKLEIINIQPIFETMLNSLSGPFSSSKPDLTEENLQSRIRGNILMALSNKFGNLLITTGNKSEMAVGYATIYGDMCGSLNPLKDIYKTEIYRLASWRNQNIPEISVYKKTNLIPQNILTKSPSAELRPDQKDSDSLPEYEILDAILFALIEEQKSVAEIISAGHDEKIVKKVAKLFYNSEYKRKQAVIGLKVSTMSFDKDRRYPITNKFTI